MATKVVDGSVFQRPAPNAAITALTGNFNYYIMGTEVATTKKAKHELAEQITFSSEQIQLMKDTVAKGATDNEFALFMHLAKTYGLDPFAKEIWCMKYGTGPATIFSSRDGYLKIASRDANMDGLQSDVVYSGDTLEKLVDGTVKHTYGRPRGEIIGAYALVFRKDRSRPAYFYAPFSEYGTGGNNPTWRKYPSAMIVKVAEACALKRAFSLSGLVTQEEIGVDAEPVFDAETSAVVVSEPLLSGKQIREQAEGATTISELTKLWKGMSEAGRADTQMKDVFGAARTRIEAAQLRAEAEERGIETGGQTDAELIAESEFEIANEQAGAK